MEVMSNLKVTKTNKTTENALVVKQNDLIISRYNLSLAEQKLILQVVSMIQKDDEDFKDYLIKVSDYLDLIESSASNTYKKIKEFTELLLKKPLYIPQDDKNFIVCNWFSSLRYINKKGYLICRFDPILKPYLLKLKKNFTSYKLKNILKLKSKYSIRLYEILKCYQGIGHIKIKVDELREILVIPSDYRYNDIKKQILKTSQKELKKLTDIAFDFQEIKDGRKVYEINFLIFSNFVSEDNSQLQQTKIDDSGPVILEDQDILKQFKDIYKIIPTQYKSKTLDSLISNYIKEKGYLYVKQNIDYVLQQKNVNNFILYLKKALENDYGYAATSEIDVKIKQDDAKVFFEAARNIDFEYKNNIFKITSCRYDAAKKTFFIDCKRIDQPEHGVILGASKLEDLYRGLKWLGEINYESIKDLF